MKSYLGLVFEYAKVHKKKNRLLILCIAISVMLVTAIFGLADMALKAQINETIGKYGKWHAIFLDISDQVATSIAERPDVVTTGFVGTASSLTYKGKELVVQSSNEKLANEMNLYVTEGRYPQTENEALLDRLGLEQFGLTIGDTVTVSFNDGQVRQYRITGTYNDFSSLKSNDAHGMMLAENSLRFLSKEDYRERYYVQFKPKTKINEVIKEIQSQFRLKEDQISANKQLLRLIGQSNESNMQEIYMMAVMLSFLVLLASIFMIASSFNMTILERTQFFGMLRCLGATKKQIKRYVRLDGLLYCMKGIPLGLLLGCIIQWLAILILNALNSPYLPQMSLFQISLPALIAGVVIGLLVVMIASSSPAKHASKVSPQAAITGNMKQLQIQHFKKASTIRYLKVDTVMGVHHTFANKKNLFLIAGSFAISIILFLCFTVFFNFMNHALKPIKPYAPDLTIIGANEDSIISHSLKEEIETIEGIDKVYGRMGEFEIPSKDKNQSNLTTLISYDDPQFKWAQKLLIKGTIENVQYGEGVLVNYDQAQAFGWELGDIIQLTINHKTYSLPISAILSEIPIDSSDGEWIIVCSEPAFIPSTMKLLDMQQENKEIHASYMTMAIFIYGFLGIIALIAIINIINTINGSISSRLNHYGVMRAVGMSTYQLKKVILFEAVTYAVIGDILGSSLGFVLHNILFNNLITDIWGTVWKPPILMIIIVSMSSIIMTLISVIAPTNKIKKMNIIDVVKVINV